jgi:predicted branched-subunit amino acid permease
MAGRGGQSSRSGRPVTAAEQERPDADRPDAAPEASPRQLRSMLPLLSAEMVDAMTFGALARAAGMGVLGSITMSVTSYSSSAQYATLAMVARRGSPWALLATILLLNARYLLMGATVAPYLPGPAWSRGLRALLITDESWALAHRGAGRYDLRMLTLGGLCLFAAWTFGTGIGAEAGGFIGNPERLGLDAAYPVFFIGLLGGYLSSRRARWIAVAGMLIAIALNPLAPAGLSFVIAGLAGTALGFLR